MTRPQRIACAVVRGWTRVYTSGLAAEAAERRRAEMDSDLWESLHDRDPSAGDAAHLLGRALRSVGHDLRWRVEMMAPGRRTHVARLAIATAILGLSSLLVLRQLIRVGALPPVPHQIPERNLGPLGAPPPPPPPPPSSLTSSRSATVPSRLGTIERVHAPR